MNESIGSQNCLESNRIVASTVCHLVALGSCLIEPISCSEKEGDPRITQPPLASGKFLEMNIVDCAFVCACPFCMN